MFDRSDTDPDLQRAAGGSAAVGSKCDSWWAVHVPDCSDSGRHTQFSSARRYARAVTQRYTLWLRVCMSVRPSVCRSQVGVLLKRLHGSNIIVLAKRILQFIVQPATRKSSKLMVFISHRNFVPNSGLFIPVYKKGDRSDPGNYRPISLLSVFDKILEKINV